MTLRYVGAGGSNANSGLTWPLRKLTLTGVEATVAAGDSVYCGPGIYRETLTTVIAGSNGSPITYIGDESGLNTDGIGGEVRITGSDDDKVLVRSINISSSHNYRTFRGFHLDGFSAESVLFSANTNNILEQCCVHDPMNPNGIGVLLSGAGQSTHIIRRCLILFMRASAISFSHTATVDNTAHIVENCILVSASTGVASTRVGGITVRNCLFPAIGGTGVRIVTAVTAGQSVTVNDCIFLACALAVQGLTLGDIVEDYNTFSGNNTDRQTVNVGTHSQVYAPLLAMPLLTLGVTGIPLGFLDASSGIASIAGTGVPADDLFGTTRLATSSWGPIQAIATQRAIDAGEPRGRRG